MKLKLIFFWSIKSFSIENVPKYSIFFLHHFDIENDHLIESSLEYFEMMFILTWETNFAFLDMKLAFDPFLSRFDDFTVERWRKCDLQKKKRRWHRTLSATFQIKFRIQESYVTVKSSLSTISFYSWFYLPSITWLCIWNQFHWISHN